MGVLRALALGPLLTMSWAAWAAAPTATDSNGVVTLRNASLEITFSAKGNMTPASVKLAGKGARNLIDLLIISYLTGESKWWFQDNKRGAQGYRHYKYEVSEKPDEARLIVSHPSDQPGDPHLRHTKTVVLRRDAAFVELDYDFVCVREGELKSDVAVPNLWFAAGLTHSAFVGPRKTLSVGPERELAARDIKGRWYAAYDPKTNEGLLAVFLSKEPYAVRCGWSRDLNYVSASITRAAVGGLRQGVRVHNRFALRPFKVEDVAKEVPALADEVLSCFGIAPVKPRRRHVAASRLKFDFDDPTLWRKYSGTVPHPAATVKASDIQNAKRNIARFAWAKAYVAQLERSVRFLVDKDGAYLENMIPATTPCSTLFTMCPACEAYPVHGRYHWSPNDPDKIVCQKCKTTYPNPKYPEDIVYVTKWGGAQRLTAYGGKAWGFFGRHHLTSTFLGNIRARKVAYMSALVKKAALVHALTDDVRYAEKVKAILLRFAQVYPNYLVHTGYNEFADIDPKVASARIGSLPEDEVTFGPNKPNRKLYPGYWMAGRATGVGMEGCFLTLVAEAYDLTCAAKRGDGTAVYSDDDRVKIERDLIFEATHLLLNDPKINNKTASNRRGAGIAGIVLGDPMRVRFGLEGFSHFVDEWYLFDGSTSESTAYGYMTLSGIFPIGQALHGYSDPPGFSLDGKRFDSLDVYGLPRYRAVFRAFYESLLPDLSYPVLADHHLGGGMGTRWAEVMFDQYGGRGSLAVLQRRYNGEVVKHGDEYALFHRPADADVSTPAEFERRSVFFPALKVGYLRAGGKARHATLVLSASDWGGHHHLDGLSVVYHVDGQECLTDLGYLWDSPDSMKTRRTSAHNLVVVDEGNQIAGGRVGRLHLFDDSGWVKVIEASSSAYRKCTEYRRTCILVDHGEAGAYVVDVFRVAGGNVHDYVLHGPNEAVELHAPTKACNIKLYDLQGVKEVTASAQWRTSWAMEHDLVFSVHAVPSPGEKAFVGTGWGQRSHRETPGATLPYVVRRHVGDNASSCFLSVFEAHRAASALVKDVRLISCPGCAVVRVDTQVGTDYVVSSPGGRAARFSDGGHSVSCEARAAVLSVSGDGLRRAYLLGGASLALDGTELRTAKAQCGGDVVDIVDAGLDSYIVVKASDLPPASLVGRWVVVDDGEITTGYPIERIERTNGVAKLFTKSQGRGFRVDAAAKWTIWHAVVLTK